MKLIFSLALIAASVLPALADRWEIEWWPANTIPGKQGIMVSKWYSNTNGAAGEDISYRLNACLNNPGPRGMQQFCVSGNDGDQWARFIFAGQNWRCLKLTSTYYQDPNDKDKQGKEIWSEVSC
ncbi:hypothetical protein B0T14DRAFT_599027 [Immersiella caudata]|uniref:Secreted protein n=1 Tax=Immersiella caudata TaxID=314043 RepID=A0AA39XGZ1_9PEZI|nr:hypothetical protein B0T14DRAFT_599027 [Immersiella caudata]